MITVSHLSKSYGEQVLFDDTGFALGAGERLGLVGRNGHGKTTLFRLLLGEETPDAGSIVAPKDYRIGHLAQQLSFGAPTVLDEVLAVLGDRRETDGHRAEAALMGLGFAREDLARPATSFSGGFQIRVNLARVLVDQPNLLLLDEPTNYLDIVATRWLERFLMRWPHELIVITHDRRFLERVTTHSMMIHRRKLRRMAGPVEKLAAQIATEEEVHEKARRNAARKRRQDERFIERFRAKASKASVVKSRMRALERRGTPEALEGEADLSFRFQAAPFLAATLLRVEGLGFAYPGGPDLVGDLSFEVAPGERVAVIGPNGRGKSTLLNLLAGELVPQRGTLRAHPATSIAFFGQTNIDRLDPGRTIEEEIGAGAPDLGRGAVAGLCGLLMFPGDAARKPISVLSGGERSRVLLGKLLVSPSNLLLLDEPTSHLDIESVEGLLDAVEGFPGAVVLVTHEEAILERLATRLIVFDGGHVCSFEGGYRDFLDRVGWADEGEGRGGARAGASAAAEPRRSARELRRLKAEIVAARGKVTGPLERSMTALEERIHRLETEVAEHDRDMAAAAVAGRNEDLARLAAAAKAKRRSIDADFADLERVAEQLDRARAEFDAQIAALR